jgi:hypothetical protein
MKSDNRELPRRVSDSERAGSKADRPRAIDRYIAYFGDRVMTRGRTGPPGDHPLPSSPVHPSPR